ncbi:MAG TPA: hypothetical protein DEQ84_01600 [Prevotellaceae bacterium]|nr:hypothetical protein [Prevotellaceae bacterium]
MKRLYVREGGDSNELMRHALAQAYPRFSYNTEFSMPSRHVLISFARVACAEGGVKNVTHEHKG